MRSVSLGRVNNASGRILILLLKIFKVLRHYSSMILSGISSISFFEMLISYKLICISKMKDGKDMRQLLFRSIFFCFSLLNQSGISKSLLSLTIIVYNFGHFAKD